MPCCQNSAMFERARRPARCGCMPLLRKRSKAYTSTRTANGDRVHSPGKGKLCRGVTFANIVFLRTEIPRSWLDVDHESQVRACPVRCCSQNLRFSPWSGINAPRTFVLPLSCQPFCIFLFFNSQSLFQLVTADTRALRAARRRARDAQQGPYWHACLATSRC